MSKEAADSVRQKVQQFTQAIASIKVPDDGQGGSRGAKYAGTAGVLADPPVAPATPPPAQEGNPGATGE